MRFGFGMARRGGIFLQQSHFLLNFYFEEKNENKNYTYFSILTNNSNIQSNMEIYIFNCSHNGSILSILEILRSGKREAEEGLVEEEVHQY